MTTNEVKQALLEEYNKRFYSKLYKQEPGKLYGTDRSVSNMYWVTCGAEVGSFLKEKLDDLEKAVREEIINAVSEMAHYYSERELLMLNPEQRMLAEEHNKKFDRFRAKYEKGEK